MLKKMLRYGLVVVAVGGISYSARQLADPAPVKADDPVCCQSQRDCPTGTTCGKAKCDGLNIGACG